MPFGGNAPTGAPAMLPARFVRPREEEGDFGLSVGDRDSSCGFVAFRMFSSPDGVTRVAGGSSTPRRAPGFAMSVSLNDVEVARTTARA
jgi:hypothetical protein